MRGGGRKRKGRRRTEKGWVAEGRGAQELQQTGSIAYRPLLVLGKLEGLRQRCHGSSGGGHVGGRRDARGRPDLQGLHAYGSATEGRAHQVRPDLAAAAPSPAAMPHGDDDALLEDDRCWCLSVKRYRRPMPNGPGAAGSGVVGGGSCEYAGTLEPMAKAAEGTDGDRRGALRQQRQRWRRRGRSGGWRRRRASGGWRTLQLLACANRPVVLLLPAAWPRAAWCGCCSGRSNRCTIARRRQQVDDRWRW